MKKSVLALALAFGVTTAFAQDLTSKKGEPILPEAGDWGIGIDANPFLNYAGSFFGKTAPASAPTWDFMTNNQVITGRYFADEKTVYRGGIRLGFGSSTVNALTSVANGSTSTPPAYVTDTRKTGTHGIGLSAGIEMRKGKTRLQGYYGAEVGIYMGGGTHEKYTYGNVMSSTYPMPASHDFKNSSADPSITSNISGAARYTDIKAGSTFQFGIRGFIGAEYFFMPKMSLGGEFGWGLGFTSTGEGSSTNEQWNGVSNSILTTTTKVGKSSSFGLDTDNWNSVFGLGAGRLRFNMYF